jgi:hypothetical protein
VGWYLPPYNGCSIIFIQQLLNEEKFAFKKSEVVQRSVPKYQEFSMDNFLKSVGDDRDVLKHLPDKDSMDKEVDRDFAYTILNTLRPGFLREVVDHAISQRQTIT